MNCPDLFNIYFRKLKCVYACLSNLSDKISLILICQVCKRTINSQSTYYKNVIYIIELFINLKYTSQFALFF